MKIDLSKIQSYIKLIYPFYPLLKWTGIVIFVILAISSIRSCGSDKQYQQEVKKWKDSTIAVATVHAAYEKQLVQSSVDANKKADSLVKVIKNFQPKIIHVPDTLIAQTISSAPDTCQKVIEVLSAVTSERDGLAAALLTEKAIALKTDSLRVVAHDSLAKADSSTKTDLATALNQIKKVPVYKEPKILWVIPEPSCKASFVVGIITGVVGDIIIHNIKH